MKYILTTIFFLILNSHLFGQNKMVISKPFGGYVYYQGFDEEINSISELPESIQLNLTGYLKKFLGSMSDSTNFLLGQVIDLNGRFKKDSLIYGYEWVIPKYDLNFTLQDNSLGIKNYNLKIRLDKYGQLLQINWPRKKYDNKSNFISNLEIEKFALEQAKLKRYDTSTYLVDFRYNERLDKLCWIFKFPALVELKRDGRKNKKRFYVFEIDWKELRIVDEYENEQFTIN